MTHLENLAMEGWRRIHKPWICPDCVVEVREQLELDWSEE